jgi:hypothetical protein
MSNIQETLVGKPLRLSDISQARQVLVRLFQAVNHGRVEGLEVRRSEPVLDPLPMILKDVKLDKTEEPRFELILGDFILSGEVSRMLDIFDKMNCGVIRLIEVREGIPRRMLMESQKVCIADHGASTPK